MRFPNLSLNCDTQILRTNGHNVSLSLELPSFAKVGVRAYLFVGSEASDAYRIQVFKGARQQQMVFRIHNIKL